MIVVLLAVLAVGAGGYFGCYRLGVWTINHGYMAPDAVELRNQRHERSLQQYVASNNVSSRDTVAIEQWLRREKNASVIVYQAQGDPYEAGTWGTSQLLDDTTQNDLATLGYSFYTVQFAATRRSARSCWRSWPIRALPSASRGGLRGASRACPRL